MVSGATWVSVRNIGQCQQLSVWHADTRVSMLVLIRLRYVVSWWTRTWLKVDIIMLLETLMLLLLSQWTVKSGASSVAAALMFLFGNLVDDPTSTTTASEVRSTAVVESASRMQCKRLTVSACNAALQRVTPALTAVSSSTAGCCCSSPQQNANCCRDGNFS